MESRALIFVCDLASGGMGRVEIALRRETNFERLFAVKRLHPHYASEPQARDMFLDEARIAGLIRHPNVVHVVDVGHDVFGPFLVMEYVEGLPLSQIVRQHAAKGELIPVSVGMEIIRQSALGLQAAHELTDADGARLGLIHRDVSPQNILVGYDGCARLTDFGIAKATERITKTQTGVLKGKMGYFSPEQLRFEDATQRSDLFSLGVVLYEVLAGQRLYGQGDQSATARRILYEPTPDLADIRPDVPPQVIGLVFRLLAKDPADRSQTAKDVADVLAAGLRMLPPDECVDLAEYMRARHSASQQSRRTQISRVLAGLDADPTIPTESLDVRRRRRGFIGAAVVLCVLGVVGAILWGSETRESQAESFDSAESMTVVDSGSVELQEAEAQTQGADVASRVAESAESDAPIAPPEDEVTRPPAGTRKGRGRVGSTDRGMRGHGWVDEW